MKKSNKTLLLSLGTIGAVVAPVASLVSCNLFGGGSDESDKEFMNYVDYISDAPRSLIESRYTYTEFGDLPELKVAIQEERIAGGIGSDYYNAYLAGTGAISKIDFARLYKMPELANSATLHDKLKDIYSSTTMSILDAFDKDMILRLDNGKPAKWDADGKRVPAAKGEETHDLDNDGDDDFLWEYMAPYFAQNKVLAVNIQRLFNAGGKSVAELKDSNGDFIDQTAFEALVKTKLGSKELTYTNILDVLKTEFGANQIIVNNYMRDNLMIGSEITNNGTVQAPLDQATVTKQSDAFFGMIKNFDSKPDYSDSGVGTLDFLVSNQVGGAQVGIMYNGDALYSNYGGSQNGDEGMTRIITPKNSTFLLDGMIIPSYMNDSENIADKIKMYDIIGEALYSGIQNQAKINEVNTGTQQLPVWTGGTINPSFKRLNNAFANFDNVNYTPAFKQLYKYVMDEQDGYFNDGTSLDTTSRGIMKSTEDAENAIGTNFNNNITSIVDGDFEQEITNIYNSNF